MSSALLMYHYLSIVKHTIRKRQMVSGDFIGTVGAFLVKKGQKTIIEELEKQAESIERMLGGDTKPKEKEKDRQRYTQNFFKELVARGKIRGN